MQLMSNTKKKTKKRSSWTVWSRGADDDDDEDAQSPGASSPVEAARHDAATTTTPQRRGLLRIFWDSAAAVAPLTTSFWGGGSKHQKRVALCGTLLAVGLAQAWLLTKLSHWRSRVDTALQAKDPDGFVEAIRVLLRFVGGFTCLSGTAIFLYGRLTISWKEVLSGDLIAKYVATGLFLVMNVVKCGAFLTMLYRLMPESLVAVLAISALDTAVTTLIIGPPLRVFTFSRIEAEADLRAALMRAQQYAEEIVLFRGGDRELARCQRQLDGILGIQRSRRDWDAGCGVYRGLADWVTNLVPTLLIAPAYFRGDVEFGAITKVGIAYGTVRSGFMVIANNIANVASVAVSAGASRRRGDWSARLSLGEQQRLSVARALLKRPALCVLDESTSALDVGTEARLYRLLRANVALVVSVAHRPTAMDFHTHVLECARLARDESNPAAALREWRFRALRAPVTRV
ncbi:ATP-binding cassette sub-family D [Aureococcus anophagefferens]|nr:ATP-binding cassette sub-family D [Aureococcus anophagefferens]